MEYKELLKKTPSELNSLLLEYRSELFILRFKNQSSNLDQTHKISQIRKIIARILTILSEQKLAQNPKPKKLTKKQKKASKAVFAKSPKSIKAHFNAHIKPLLAPKIQTKPAEMSSQNEQ
ncbi:50S ribosomal protein L29 [Mesomycoplasma ovipneumoniae]|uniref:Large ribosomal subunit protein uL29 n=1 Tax=Mesomycoplasma ovipneumoniae TaxID=29562 RepID=A0AAJ2P647_9BACT|nr:50S ribosomal protein L29 [Mesomycoplasma ovipneumoniae]MDW2892469.1 50S ribosomal protein L29 [Mesomycoplasma ovipneumoniae]MDW2908151.1 50S ribosomal protein L29 [Mesomycoplasma ovipneumoniae]